MLRDSVLAATLGTLTLALLAGCSHGRATAGLAPDVGLFFNQYGQTASLAYGRANSDSVGLMLQCEAGSSLIEVSDPARSDAANRLVLVSGRARSDLAARLDASTGQPVLFARAPADSPAPKGFRDSGRMQVSSRGGGYALAARPQERQRVERFFAACERA